VKVDYDTKFCRLSFDNMMREIIMFCSSYLEVKERKNEIKIDVAGMYLDVLG